MTKISSKRRSHILEAVILDYIDRAEPVGSKKISSKYAFNLCPASVRNVMAELEVMGYLYRPHASAGRIPTAKGFRFYVDRLLGHGELSDALKKRIMDSYSNSLKFKEVMRETSRILSLISHCAGIVVAPRLSDVILDHIKFFKIGGGDILVLIVSKLGITQSMAIHMEEELRQSELDEMSNYLSETGKGLSLMQLRKRIMEKMRKEKKIYNRLLARITKLSMKALAESGKDGVYVEGKLNIFEQPEFTENVMRLKELFRAFEEKGILVRLLDKSINTKGVLVNIGFDELEGIKGCSLVSAPYGNSNGILGTLGVMGPVRMNYAIIIPLVRYTANLLGNIIESKRLDMTSLSI